jgi:hypothetical protein
MELTLDSALSAGGLVGHLSYLLLVVSMLMRSIGPLRMFAIASALVGIGYDLFWVKDPIGVFWESLLLSVNVFQLAVIRIENSRAHFSDEEAEFVESKFPHLSRAHGRKMLNAGLWVTGEPETTLTTEGEPVHHLIFLASGEATVASAGQVVAVCDPGAFIGEMTVLTGEPANGTATLSKQSRYWAVEAATLRKLVKSIPEIDRALQSGFARNLRDKLVRSNRFIVGSDAAED